MSTNICKKCGDYSLNDTLCHKCLKAEHALLKGLTTYETVAKPVPGKRVIIIARNVKKGLEYPAFAEWIPKHWRSTQYHEYHGDPDYWEENDEFYWPEGWYEVFEEADEAWFFSDPVIGWMYPIPFNHV